jgi:enoyl-CoA hydratase/carnithine racemase
MSQNTFASWVRACHSLVHQMRAARKPLLAAIHGTAVRGGLEIVLHCDVRFATHDATLGQPEVNIGLIPPVGDTQALARLLGRPRALRAVVRGQAASSRPPNRWTSVSSIWSYPRKISELARRPTR